MADRLLRLTLAGWPCRHRKHAGGHVLLQRGVGLAFTVWKNIAYALRSEVGTLPGRRLWYRAVVEYLHFLQPFARAVGQIRGVLSPPEVALPAAPRQTSRGPRPSLREAWRALLLLCGSLVEDRFWSETWTTADRVLADLTGWLRSSRAVRTIEVDEGWSHDRDVSVLVGRWAWIDVRAIVEDHGAGKSLLRVSTNLRPTTLGVVSAVALATPLLRTSAGVALRWPLAGVSRGRRPLLRFLRVAQAQATAILHSGVEAVAASRHEPMEGQRARGCCAAVAAAETACGARRLRLMILATRRGT